MAGVVIEQRATGMIPMAGIVGKPPQWERMWTQFLARATWRFGKIEATLCSVRFLVWTSHCCVTPVRLLRRFFLAIAKDRVQVRAQNRAALVVPVQNCTTNWGSVQLGGSSRATPCCETATEQSIASPTSPFNSNADPRILRSR